MTFLRKGYRIKSIYSSYEKQARYCGSTPYQEDELVHVILLKTKNFIKKLETETIPIWLTSAYSKLSILNPIIESNKEELNVIDFGGACGAHYFHLRKMIDNKIKFNWVVVETPKMVQYARELSNEELSFSDNLEETIKEMKEVDLLHTSGTLQCVDNPYKYLSIILNSGAKWVLFNRLGLNKSESDVVTILRTKLSWNGIGELPEGFTDKWISYPFIYVSEKTFLNEINKNYKVVAKFEESSGSHKVKKIETFGYGLICKLKKYAFYILFKIHSSLEVFEMGIIPV